jgi:undecaprenyl-diphosphatase
LNNGQLPTNKIADNLSFLITFRVIPVSLNNNHKPFKVNHKALNCFVLFLISFSVSYGQGNDIKWLDKINSPPNAATDKAWEFVSKSVTPISLATPISMFVAGHVTHNKELKLKSYKTGATLLVAGVISSSLKVIVQRERPFITYPDIIYQKTEVGSHSFPSGHTNFAFATATSLTLAFPKWYVIVPAYSYAAAVGYSRMYLGVHYPSDVLAGALIGSGSALLTWKAQKWLTKKRRK